VVAATKDAHAVFLERRWDKTKFVAILLDGVRIGPAQVVVAVGIDKAGCKHVLGWNHGPSEKFVVCRDLIRQLVERGLDPDGNYLFVIDGSKGLAQAIKNVFGEGSAIQRCQEHKIRDIEGYLNRREAKVFRIKLQAAYNESSYQRASDRLQKIRRELLNVSEKAASSLTEGLESTLTLHRLGITGGVRESLRTTNIIESTFARLRHSTRNVNQWQEPEQVERWLAFTLLKAEAGYRRLPGYRQLARLHRQVAASQTALQSPKA
jgi:transposase-like protein